MPTSQQLEVADIMTRLNSAIARASRVASEHGLLAQYDLNLRRAVELSSQIGVIYRAMGATGKCVVGQIVGDSVLFIDDLAYGSQYKSAGGKECTQYPANSSAAELDARYIYNAAVAQIAGLLEMEPVQIPAQPQSSKPWIDLDSLFSIKIGKNVEDDTPDAPHVVKPISSIDNIPFGLFSTPPRIDAGQVDVPEFRAPVKQTDNTLAIIGGMLLLGGVGYLIIRRA